MNRVDGTSIASKGYTVRSLAKTWYYDNNVKRFRNPDGRFVSETKITSYRDSVLDAAKIRTKDLTDRLASGELSSARFKTEMRKMIKETYGAQYVFGRGGFRNMTPADWGRVGAEVKRQYKYLDGFIEAINRGDQSDEKNAWRAQLYASGSVQAHSRGLAASWGIDLPGHPGDGATECRSNCRCHWRIEKLEDQIMAYWTVGGSDPCTGCKERAAEWDPFIASGTV